MSASSLSGPDGIFFDLAQHRNVIFYHMGYFSHRIVATMAEVVKLQLEVCGVSGPTRRKLFSSFVELSQNIIHYSSDALAPDSTDTATLRQGAVCITIDADRYLMWCANPIATSDTEKLRDKLEPLRDMSVEQIKQAYKVSLRAETPDDSKGAGLGFLTMARDASAAAFYTPIIQQLRSYLATCEGAEITANVALAYFNSSSTKMLFSIFDALDQAAQAGTRVKMNWYHDEEDDTILEFGEELQADFQALDFTDHPVSAQ